MQFSNIVINKDFSYYNGISKISQDTVKISQKGDLAAIKITAGSFAKIDY